MSNAHKCTQYSSRALFPQRMTLWLGLGCLAFSLAYGYGCSTTPAGQEENTTEAKTNREVVGEIAQEQGKTEPAKEQAKAEPSGVDAGQTEKPSTSPDQDLVMKAEDFGCILKWAKVNRYRITNRLGFAKQALQVANSKTGGTFPPGTIIQLVPQEAMVKRKKGWSPKTNDWEFFFLKVDKKGTTIAARGGAEVKNGFGGSCYNCHSKAASKWDLICATGHGCDPLPLSPAVIESIQNSDPRCP